jgi:hypothetical protein
MVDLLKAVCNCQAPLLLLSSLHPLLPSSLSSLSKENYVLLCHGFNHRMSMYPRFLSHFFIVISVCILSPIQAQLRIASANTGLNFRQGPGVEYNIIQTIGTSNLLVVLPREPQNDFVEVFDVETSSRGYVSQNHIQITDTLMFGKQNYFEKSGEAATGDIEIELINGTIHTLFVWINKISYDIAPREKKTLILDDEEVIYFSSTPGLFPVFGKEFLQRGNTYIWKIVQD